MKTFSSNRSMGKPESRKRPTLTQHNCIYTKALKQIIGQSIFNKVEQLNIYMKKHEAQTLPNIKHENK